MLRIALILGVVAIGVLSASYPGFSAEPAQLGPGITAPLSLQASNELHRTTFAEAQTLLGELQKDSPDAAKKAEQWVAAYHMVAKLERQRLSSGPPAKEEIELWRQTTQLEAQFARYLQQNSQHVDELCGAVEDARLIVASLDARPVRRDDMERTRIIYSELAKLNTLVDSPRFAGDMRLEGSYLRLQLMLIARNQPKDDDIRKHIDLAFKTKGQGAFQCCFDEATFLSTKGYATGGRIVQLLMEQARTDEEKELVAYSRLELLQREYLLQTPDMLRLTQEFLKSYPTSAHTARVTYLEGEAYFWMGKMPEAVAAFDRARRTDAAMYEASTFRICEAYRMERKYREAMDELKTIKPTATNEKQIEEVRKKLEAEVAKSLPAKPEEGK